MKKTVFSVAMAFAAGLFVSCTTAAPKVSLTDATKADSLAYAIGISQTQGLKDYLVNRMDVDTTYMGEFVNGVLDGVNARWRKCRCKKECLSFWYADRTAGCESNDSRYYQRNFCRKEG